MTKRAVFGYVGLTVVLVVGLGFLGFYLVDQSRQKQKLQQPQPVSLGQRTLVGHLGCLPKKGPGPHTTECALGLQTTEGYYQLDGSRLDKDLWAENLLFEDEIRLTGEVVKADEVGDYDVVGKMVIAKIEVIKANI